MVISGLANGTPLLHSAGAYGVVKKELDLNGTSLGQRPTNGPRPVEAGLTSRRARPRDERRLSCPRRTRGVWGFLELGRELGSYQTSVQAGEREAPPLTGGSAGVQLSRSLRTRRCTVHGRCTSFAPPKRSHTNKENARVDGVSVEVG